MEDDVPITGGLVAFVLTPGILGTIWGLIVASRLELSGWWRLGLALAHGVGVSVMFAGGVVLVWGVIH